MKVSFNNEIINKKGVIHMAEDGFTIGVIGLGLIGGSMAMALKGFKNCHIIGIDIDKKVCKAAKDSGVFEDVSQESSLLIPKVDLLIMCTYPKDTLTFVKNNIKNFEKHLLITDVTGIKEEITEKISSLLPESIEFIGGHPMAGREVDGFINARSDLFKSTGFLITPSPHSSDKGINLIWEMAKYIGSGSIEIVSPKKHDEIIAYTSHLMHLSAAALCLNPNSEMTSTYTAGAFRDCTRIAKINPRLWSELFIDNKKYVLEEIDKFQQSIEMMRSLIEEEDYKGLEDILDKVRINKEALLQK